MPQLYRPTLLILLLSVGVLVGLPGVPRVQAVPNPTSFYLLANFSAWNLTDPNNGPLNPTVTVFRGVLFTARIEHDDVLGVSHNFAIYKKGAPPTNVSSTDTCVSSVRGCLKRSATVTATSPLTSMTFTPTVPADDFTGSGRYEYYCQFHPTSMHGGVSVIKNPDQDGNRVIDIIDIATIAFSFGSKGNPPPPTPTWNIAADLDNDGDVDIIDVATGAFYFGLTY